MGAASRIFRPASLWTGLVFVLAVGTANPTTGSTTGQPANDYDLTSRWGVGVSGGFTKLVEGEWDYSTVGPLFGGHISKGLSSQWNLTLALNFGEVEPGATFPGEEVGFGRTGSFPLRTKLVQPSLLVRHRISPSARLSPVLGIGLGLTDWRVTDASGQTVEGFDIDGETATLEGSNATITLALGLDLALGESLRLDAGVDYDIIPDIKKDNIGLSSIWGPADVDANTALVTARIGLTWWFGSGDRDRDGVPNSRDLCPDEPEDRDGYNDNDGCPEPDNDEDGILDADDACPSLAEDLDGFQDEDGCPDPDNDGDGINDGRDRCPNEAEDVDGWEDQDGCPDLDNDQDGVPDDRDKCPRTRQGVTVDADGCAVTEPQVSEPTSLIREPEVVEVLEGVKFRSGSAELTPESISELIALAGTLNRESGSLIEIRGHTDSSGDAAANLDLSRRRAAAVRESLIQMGIAAERLTAVGYGEERPVADNGTPSGRAKNRRVEVHRR